MLATQVPTQNPERRCQVVGPRALLGNIELERDVSSTGTGRLPPLYKGPGSKDAVIDSSEVVTPNTEQGLNRTMDGREMLDPGH